MSVPLNTRVLVARTALRWLLSFQHLAVLRNTVAVTLGNVCVGAVVVTGWCPGQVVAADLNIIVRKFTKLIVVHPEKLSFLGRAQMQAWDLVNNEGQDGADDKSVGGDGNNISKLDVQLLPVVLDPSAREKSSIDTIEADDGAVSKDAVGKKTDHTSDTVFSEHVKGIVNFDPKFNYKNVRLPSHVNSCND
jgi:hypothetical protein